MKRNSLDPELQDLPVNIPIFPLDGALLLPSGRLPLNVFEPRYLNMVSDTLSTPASSDRNDSEQYRRDAR